MTPLAEEALKIATTQIGVQEVPKGSNAGPQVEKYLKSVGLGKGYAWCMAFVFYCSLEASKKKGTILSLKKTAGVMDQWNSKPTLRKSIPEAGDVFIMDFGKGVGHTGLVEKVLSSTTIQTIEGNTNTDGSREGYAVCRRTRSISSCKGFLRI